MSNQPAKLGAPEAEKELGKAAFRVDAVIAGNAAAAELINELNRNDVALELARDAFNSAVNTYLKYC
jgi:hypothetical protein